MAKIFSKLSMHSGKNANNNTRIIDETTPLMVLAGPMFVELLLNILINNIDTVMLSHYDEIAVGAVGNANQVMFLLIIMFNIIATSTSVVVAQYLGAEKHDKMNMIYTLATQLYESIAETEQQIKTSETERQNIRNRIRRANPEEKSLLKAEAKNVTAKIKPLREKLKKLKQTECEFDKIQKLFDTELMLEKQAERNKNLSKER